MEIRAGQQQLRQVRHGIEEVLDVIEHQQHLPVAQPGAQCRGRVAASRFLQPDRPGDGGEHQRGIAERRQLNPNHPIRVEIRHRAGHVEREAGFAHPARADQGQQSPVGMGEQVPHHARLALATDEGRWLTRQLNAWGAPRCPAPAPGSNVCTGPPRSAAASSDRSSSPSCSASASRRSVSG